MTSDKKLAVFCDKCKKPVIVNEGDTILKLINLEYVTTFFEDNKPKLKSEMTFCPECSSSFTQWLDH